MNEEIKSELLTLSQNFGEVALDNLISEGIFKDIPVVGTLLSFQKLGNSISDYFLITRIICFINELGINTQEEIEELKRKYFKDKDYPQIGSKILLILEKTDSNKKIKWLAKSFRLFLDRNITKSNFLKLASIINNVYVEDAEKILFFDKRSLITSNNNLTESYVLDHLFSVGLIENRGIDGGDMSGGNSGTIYRLNKFGEIFYNKILQ